MSDKYERTISGDEIRKRRERAEKLVKQLQGAKREEGSAHYSMGKIINLVWSSELWLDWPRSVKDSNNRRGKRSLGFGYKTFADWCWHEAGLRYGTARRYAADYRRMRELDVAPKGDHSDLWLLLAGIGSGKRHLVLRFVDANVDDPAKGRKLLKEWATIIATYRMTTNQVRAAFQYKEDEEDSLDDYYVPELTGKAIPMAPPPKKRPKGWRLVDEELRAAAQAAIIYDKAALADHLAKAQEYLSEAESDE